jgi:hypothetical protein
MLNISKKTISIFALRNVFENVPYFSGPKIRYEIYKKAQNVCFMYFIQHCFICRPQIALVSENARIGPKTVATLELAVSRCSILC